MTFGFRHLNLDGSDSCWRRLTYRFGPVFEDLGDEVSTIIYNRHQLLVEDTEEDDEDGEFHAPIQMGKNGSSQRVEMKVPSNEMVVFFIRVFTFHASTYEFVNKHYLKDE